MTPMIRQGYVSILTAMVVISVLSCTPQRPPGVLSEQQMVNVLMEIYQDEEKISRAYIPYDSVTIISPLIRQRILRRVNVTDSVFKISMHYYMLHPKELDRIYGALVDSLSFREQRMLAPDGIPR
ncbi:MAG: DUF4296 domain-containing protein [Cyclobacteriaceae bacterium]